MPFYGRERELKSLKLLSQKKTPSLIVLQGRRRIGKSSLIEYFAKQQNKTLFYKFSGLAPNEKTTAQDQRVFFAAQFKTYFGFSITTEDWWDLLIALAAQIPDGNKNIPVIILLDEISWMADQDPTFLPKLKEAWDSKFKQKNPLILVLCGSVSSWIEENILGNTGFVGRISLKLVLKELPLPICQLFFGNIRLSAHEKLKFLSITGGVPKYLEEFNPELSVDENIKYLCFMKEGFLYNEFDRIFNDALLSNAAVYQKIVVALAESALERTDLIKKVNLADGGDINLYLNNLITAGFITREYTWSLKNKTPSKFSKFRLSDNYLRFYLRAIAPNREKVDQDLFAFSSLANLPGWSSFIGLQFENLILNNRHKIFEKLNIPIGEILMSNPYFQRPTSKKKGCQIDFLIQTKTNILYVCEAKFLINPVDSSVLAEIKEKIERLNIPKGFSIIPVLIHVNGIAEGASESDFFYRSIDFESLFQ